MEGFDQEQFSALTGRAGKRQQRMQDKKLIEKNLKNTEYEEKHQKSL